MVTVATVLTACGIETSGFICTGSEFFKMLQQCLPLAVLKLNTTVDIFDSTISCNSAYRLRY